MSLQAGLEPTHQVVKLARDAGFTNVHDYLVHLVTDETAEQISARKLQHSWGSWLKQVSSDASEQTGACWGCFSAGCSQEEAGSSQQQEHVEPGAVAQADRAGGKANRDTAVTDFFCCSKPTSCRSRPASVKAAAVVQGVLASKDQECGSNDTAVEDDSTLLLSSQDGNLTRKQRIMQRMGLAPVTAS
eukprot:GHRR01028614.1.p1 GENE.GHRR01028614.1~~GHRR01028614.1.p1  ORF type:complete len:188 (+),score=80.59 GHRR01028614.1:678-1241(+)